MSDRRAAAERVVNTISYWIGDSCYGPPTWTGDPTHALTKAYLRLMEETHALTKAYLQLLEEHSRLREAYERLDRDFSQALLREVNKG